MNTKTSTSSFLLGPSLAFDIPIGKAHLVLQGDYRFPISTGSGVMPSFQDTLTKEQIQELAKYVYTEIQGRQ